VFLHKILRYRVFAQYPYKFYQHAGGLSIKKMLPRRILLHFCYKLQKFGISKGKNAHDMGAFLS